MEDAKQVVIIGAGAGGLPLATSLGARYRHRDDVNVLLIDQSMVHVWKPMLHEVAAGTLTANEDEINLFSHGEQHGYEFQFGRLERLDRGARQLYLAPHLDDEGQEVLPPREVAYDLLVFAVGGSCDDFGTEGVAEHAIFIDDRESGEQCHAAFVNALLGQECAETGSGNAVIVGAGATGVELAAQLQAVIDSQARLGRSEQGDPLKIILLEAADQCLPSMEPELATRLEQQLRDMGIDVRLSTAVEGVNSDSVHTGDGTIDAGLVIWAAGIKAHDWLCDLGLKTDDKNRIVANGMLQSVTDKNVLAFGDCAAVPHGNAVVPALAQAAFQQADYLARQIPKLLEDQEVESPFQFVDRGTLITLAGQDAAGSVRTRLVRRFRLYGVWAKIAYRMLYRRHQLAIVGPWQTTNAILRSWLAKWSGPQSSGPQLKLH